MYSQFTELLLDVCQDRHIPVHCLGKVGKKQRLPFYAIVLEPPKFTETVCISAGIHGDEVAGPYAVLEFLKKVNVASLFTRVILFPVANPTGFDQGTRRNEWKKDLNRHFDDKNLVGEKRLIYHFLKQYHLSIFHTLHEDMNEEKFYMYIYCEGFHPIAQSILKKAKKFFAIQKRKQVCGDPNENGIIYNRADGSLEERIYKEQKPIVISTETPLKQVLKKRVKLNVQLIENTIKEAAKMGQNERQVTSQQENEELFPSLHAH